MSEPIPRLRLKPSPETIGRLKVRILKAWHSKLAEIREPKMKGRATRDFVQLYNSGLLLPEGFTQPKHISRSGLRGWEKIYKEKGLHGLIPKYKAGKRIADNLVPMLPTYKRIVISGNPDLRFKTRIFLPEIHRQWKWPPLQCPLMIVMFFSMEVPKGISMKRRMRMLRHECPHYWTPRLDDLVRFAKSCLRDIVYKEDCQIICLHVEKHYGWFGAKTEIFIRRLRG